LILSFGGADGRHDLKHCDRANSFSGGNVIDCAAARANSLISIDSIPGAGMYRRRILQLKGAVRMSSNTNKKQADKNEAKKAVVLGAGKKSRVPILVFVAGVFLMAVGVIFYLITKSSNQTGIASAPASADGIMVVALPVSLFEDGKARHFEYTDGALTIRYFILKSSDGIIRAAFDACDVCWPAGKGYFQDGDQVVCRNCGRRFASVLVNEVKGGCNPAPLNRNVVNGQVIIQVKDIMDGKQYFDFPDGT
jgi:uncharacterized membrane protein